jgi:hypothetical protein
MTAIKTTTEKDKQVTRIEIEQKNDRIKDRRHKNRNRKRMIII